jgi:undecaprenyl-diphosphatase
MLEFLYGLPLLVKAAILGLVEGLTEFLPISSTGHLILAGSLLGFHGEKEKLFDVAIQTGAMFAVVWYFRVRIATVIAGLGSNPIARRFVLNVLIAFMPAAVLGLVFGKTIKAVLFKPVPVAIAFIVGAFVILWAEARQRRQLAAQLAISQEASKESVRQARQASRQAGVPVEAVRPVVVGPRVQHVDDMTRLDALKLGLAQAFALIPGTSRSGATIIGGMLFGLSRQAATEFSFFLAMPTLIGAGAYDIYKYRDLLSMSDLPMFAIGMVVSFISALACVRWLLRYVATNDFVPFAYYRIVFGVLVLMTSYFGWVQWLD